MKKPLVSIIIPVYNAEKYLAETLACALEQSYDHTEIIIIDDGSTDQSLALTQSFSSDKIRIETQENRGGNAARNKGLELARGELIQFWDADDLMDEYKIEAQVRRLAAAPEGSVAFCPWYRFYERPGDFMHDPSPTWRDFERPAHWLVEHFKGRAMMPPIGWLTPRSVIDRAGRWDESLIINQDGEYFARVILNASRLVCTNEVNIYYRSGLSNSVSRRNSDEKKRAYYYSMLQILDYAFAHSDDLALRAAAPCYLKKFIRTTYPDIPDTISEAEVYLRQLGKCRKDESLGKRPSRPYRILEAVIGWKNAARFKRMLGRY